MFPNFIVQNMKLFFKHLIEQWMLTERDQYLKTTPHTKANGFYERKLSSTYGEIEDLNVPRTRDGMFRSGILPRERSTQELERLVHLLFRSGVSTRTVEEILSECFGTSLSHMTISQMASVAYEEVLKWKNRKFQEKYAVIFIDAFFFPLKRGNVESEAVYVALGITPEGCREVLEYWIPGGGEGSSNWEELLMNLKNRGLKEVDFVVADGLTGIEYAIRRIYPQAQYQYCVLHAVRSSLNKVRQSDRKNLSEDLKKIYRANSANEAKQSLDLFIEKWRKIYPKVTEFWTSRFDCLITFMKLPTGLRHYVYTTNWIERMHKEIKRRLHPMEQFQNVMSAEKILYMLYTKQNERYRKTGINSWSFLYKQYQMSIASEQCENKYLLTVGL